MNKPANTLPAAEPAAVLEAIAKRHLFVDTLVVRNRDRLDFYDIGVSSIERALQAAYQAGVAAAKAGKA